MKVNVPIKIDDEARNNLAQVIDGKPTKRLATRKEVNEVCQGLVAALSLPLPGPDRPASHKLAKLNEFVELELPNYPGKPRSYVIGICKYKYRKELRS